MRDHSASYLLISLLTLSPIILTQVACDEEATPLGESQVLIIEGNEQIIPEAIGWFPQSEETNGFKADRDQTRVVSGQGIPVLGAGTHQLNAVSLTLVGSERNGLNYPRDLDFNPERPGELWVINQRDDSAVIFEEAGSDKQRSLKVIDPAADHFMEEVSALRASSQPAKSRGTRITIELDLTSLWDPLYGPQIRTSSVRQTLTRLTF